MPYIYASLSNIFLEQLFFCACLFQSIFFIYLMFKTYNFIAMAEYMRSFNLNTLLACPLILLSLTLNAETEIQHKDLQEARLLMKTFGGELKSVLKTAMTTDGPVNALEICNIQAIPITKKNSSSSDWNISRTSLKVRNMGNEPDEWEKMTLLQFERRKSAGEDVSNMEYSEVVNDGTNTVLRYMKPIPTAGLCVTCHGNNLSNELSKKITMLYPRDKATGFNIGDIRGAFSLQKILPEDG